MSLINQAVILVGGMGTRLQSMGFDCPKPLVEIAGQPFINYLIRYFSRFGIKKILLIAGYKGEMVHNLYHGKTIYNIELSVVIEPHAMGTGGALKFAADYLDDCFLFSNGDSLFDVDLTNFITKQLSDDCYGRIILRKVEDASRYGTVNLSSSGVVSCFMEKQENSCNQLINAGIGIFLKDKILDAISTLPCSLEADIFPKWALKNVLEGYIGEGYFIDIGLPESYHEANDSLIAAISKPAVFLDRDGVINIDNGYTFKPEDLVFTKTAIDAIKYLNQAGFYVIVVSNQAGVARGLYDENAIKKFHRYMNQCLMEHGAHIDAFYYCPFHPEGIIEEYKKEHKNRKPNAGMIECAFNDWPILKQQSFLVGDKESDLMAAETSGIEGILVETNKCDLFSTVKSFNNAIRK